MMMSAGFQRTLFQTWGGSLSRSAEPCKALENSARGRKATRRRNSSSKKKSSGAPRPASRAEAEAQVDGALGGTPGNAAGDGPGGDGDGAEEQVEVDGNDDGDDDDLILVAVYEAEQCLLQREEERRAGDDDGGGGAAFPGLDSSAARVWIYPTNYPLREYQLKISGAALFHNTLVCLPTGLGKTFIASVVMYNFYRWYPSGRIVFMAPTKPLVAQQIEACFRVMGIPQDHMAELTGSTQARSRRDLWRSRRVFFLTPQVMVNDLSRQTCPADQVKCVVIDEAHKALGNHAYCQVVKELAKQTRQFRVLALSATPGGDIKAVQQVISNLLISHIELRSEESPDIQAHCHQRSLEKIVVPLGDSLASYQARYLQVLEKFMGRLTQMGVLPKRDLRFLTKYQLILAREQFRSNPHPHIVGAHQGVLEGDFALCISLCHGYELLLQMGLRSLFLFTQSIMDGTKEMARARNELQRTKPFMDLYHELEALFSKPSAGADVPFVYGHPKLQKLEEVVLQHFQTWSRSPAIPGPADTRTRVMIFSSFRESVQEIAAMLNRHAPLIRVMTFMGQASAGKGVRGFTQKEQLEVVRRFRDGGFNTLVSTCVGEEGLDIGEVDLIVCFDAQKSPIRLVQRMGRTGRRRQGRIVVILAEGREERTYNQSQSNKRSVYKSIMGKQHTFHMYPNSPRMLPDWARPTLHKMFITCGQFEPQDMRRRSSRGWRAGAATHEPLLHCGALGGRLGSVREDGFLTPSEFSLWASTMRLDEEEPQPTLGHSDFLSFKSDAPPKEREVGRLVRELSLGEWRCWQNRSFPTYRIEHSNRCQHFIEIMALLDSMRQEEGSSSYDSRLRPYLRREDVVDVNGLDKLTKTDREDKYKVTRARMVHDTNRQKSFSSFAFCAEEEDGDFVLQGGGACEHKIMSENLESPCTIIKEKAPSENDRGDNHESKDEDLPCVFESPAMDAGLNPECAIITNEDGKAKSLMLEKSLSDDESSNLHPSPRLKSGGGCGDLQDNSPSEIEVLFYLPDWGAMRKALTPKGTSQTVRAVLDNVMELLSRSPPQDFEGSVYESRDCLGAKLLKSLSKTQECGNQLQENFFPEAEFGHEVSSDLALPDKHTKEPSQDSDIGSEHPLCQEAHPGDVPVEDTGCLPESTIWEDIFDYDCEEPVRVKTTVLHCSPKENHFSVQASPAEQENSKLDESIDLFGDDDEMFIQASMFDPSHVIEDTKKQSPGVSMEEPGSLVQQVKDATAIGKKGRENKYLRDLSCTHHSASPEREDFDCSQQLFSVNFDLGYSIDEPDEEDLDNGDGKEQLPDSVIQENTSNTVPLTSDRPLPFPQNLSNSTPANHQVKGQPWVSLGALPVSPLERRCQDVSSGPFSTSSPLFRSPRRTDSHEGKKELSGSGRHIIALKEGLSSFRRSLLQCGGPFSREKQATSPTEPCKNDSDEEVLVQPRRRRRVNPLASPEAKTCSGMQPPPRVIRHHAATLHTSEESEGETVSDEDFRDTSIRRPKAPSRQNPAMRQSRDKVAASPGRQFLDDEAELSEQDGSISPDEGEGDELAGSLDGFVVDTSHLSQGLNDSEMHGIYLNSVKSPALLNKYKMLYKPTHNLDIFSQVPEQDETYKEDSFVVQVSDVEDLERGEEEEEEEIREIELLPEESFIGDRRVYPTRRWAQLRQARAAEGHKEAHPKSSSKPKRSRIIRIDDSSEEEDEGKRRRVIGEGSPAPCRPLDKPEEQPFQTPQMVPPSGLGKVAARLKELEGPSLLERCHQRLHIHSSVSEVLDFLPSTPSPTRRAEPQLEAQARCSNSFLNQSAQIQRPVGGTVSGQPLPVSVLVDSRCVAGGPELVSLLRLRHGMRVQVCSLNSCHFIVSNRMAVERQPQSEVASSLNRKRLADRVQGLQGLFDRVCLIIEKDRIKPGDASRPFQQSRYYDSTLALLLQAGVRLLFSDGPEETAALLAELAHLEQRKGQAVSVPTEVTGYQQQSLHFYLTLPCVSYVTALNMCHGFRSLGHLVDSSLEALMSGACVSRRRAEEIFRCLHYPCDVNMLPDAAACRKHSP
ncbi:Fanconi anemia group M protein isoform X2 [Scleropages formosus]|uniref:FA complementation group M n=1 Tax=Scleropages formosus TaxID=113540 RepID=A0A8C9S3Z4_SCLFO|nr:Fanconi anemia group M protein isoform X2 [Scleropages formosus]